MDNTTQKWTAVFTVMLIVGSAFLGVIGGYTRLDSRRPREAAFVQFPAAGYQRVPARLWQDPFEAFSALTNTAADSKAFDLKGHVYEIGRHGPTELSLAEPVPPGGSWRRFLRMALATVVAALAPFALGAFLLGGIRGASNTGGKSAGELEPDDLQEPVAMAEDGGAPWWAFLLLVLGTSFVVIVAGLGFCIAQQPGEEPWNFTEGMSIWASEGIRLIVVTLSLTFIILAARQHARHRNGLWRTYFSPGGDSQPPSLLRFWKRVPKIFMNRWAAPMTIRAGQQCVDATQLFLDYREWGLPLNRHLRCWLMVLGYVVPAVVFVVLVGGMPDRLCIRGKRSWLFDNAMVSLSVLGFLLVLFYALDAARLTGRLLRAIAQRATCWPAWLTRKWALKKCVREQDLDGWLDVQFTVAKTKETRRLMFYPFVLFLLLVISRSRYLDNWTWSASLVAIFVVNFILAAVCWGFVRWSARYVRNEAMSKLREIAIQIENGSGGIIVSPETAGSSRFIYSNQDYAKRLGDLCDEIEKEQRGAFASFIQDPAYAALFIPTGVTGIMTVVLQYWLSRP